MDLHHHDNACWKLLLPSYNFPVLICFIFFKQRVRVNKLQCNTEGLCTWEGNQEISIERKNNQLRECLPVPLVGRKQ